ncbi:MAG: hypothetical protein PHF86_12520 [Candidatus Nanoarchaeia archaeon]|nr:hypothetical protein [Candidatus Nanoarchaeia archaeon]
MGLFNSDQKGMHCKPTEDGRFQCERTKTDKKTGEKFGTGDRADISVDPVTCKPRFDEFNISDEELKAFDGIAERAVAGCRKNQGA